MGQRELVELHLRLAGKRGIERRRAAAIGHVGHLDAALDHQHLAEQMRDGGHARRAEVDLARVGFGVGDKFRDGVCGYRRMDGHGAPRGGEARKRHEILVGIERQRLQMPRDRHHRRRGDQEGVMVDGRVLHELRANQARGAALVVEQHALSQDLCRTVEHDAGRDVGRATRRVGHDDLDLLAGPSLRQSGGRQERGAHTHGECATTHRFSPHGFSLTKSSPC